MMETSKTAYVASRVSLKEKVREIYSELRKLGYSISYDWTMVPKISSYGQNPDLSREIAEREIIASSQCDVFILISDGAGKGMYIELGSAIISGKPKIYVIGEFLDNSVFFFILLLKEEKQ